MAGYQKVFLRIVGIIGDTPEDTDEMPDRAPVSGSGILSPTTAVGTGDVAQGPDSQHEIRIMEPIPFTIIDGMLTYDGKPYVWLPVPTGQWQWRISFDSLRIGDQLRELVGYTFPLTPATQGQIDDPGYPGINLAQYAIGVWEPGTVNLTADAIQQITIMVGRASSAATSAENSAGSIGDAAAQVAQDRAAAQNAAATAGQHRDAAGGFATDAEGHRTAAKTSEDNAKLSETAAKTSESNARASEIEAGLSADSSASSAHQSSGHADRAEQAAQDVDAAIAGAADQVVQAIEADRVAAEQARQGAEDAAQQTAADREATGLDRQATGEDRAATGEDRVQTGLDRAATGEDRVQTGLDRQAASSSASTASDAALVITENLPAIEAAPGAAQAAGDARDAAEGFAQDASGSASAAAQSATDADAHRAAAAASETSAGQSASDADAHRVAAEGHASDAATVLSGAEDARDAARQARSGAEDERVVAQDAAALAEGHAQAADGHRVDAEAAAALAQSLRWVIRGAWEPGEYEAGDVVVYDERAYYAQSDTSVEPPAQPWIPLTPAGGGGASHWDDLDGKPSVFPPEAHGHDAADVTGEATPLLDVTEASVGDQSVGEALDETTDASRLEGALTDQVDAGGATVTGTQPGGSEPITLDLNTVLAQVLFQDYLLDGIVTDVDGLQAALDETTDASRLEGALTDQVDASEAMVDTPTGARVLTAWLEGLFNNLMYLGGDDGLGAKADVDHTHTPAQVGLDQVDNTADVDKPVSTATQTALNGKADQAALDAKVQLVTDFPSSPTPGVLYLIAED